MNAGRRLAYQSFRATIDRFLGQDRVTELQFRDEWLARLADEPLLTVSGYYDPPPYGMAVLFGHVNTEVPFSFASLRPQQFWPCDRMIDWATGVMYAYCSPIYLPDGVPADFGVTLYFGRDPEVRAHFAAAYRVTRDLVREITPSTWAKPLFLRSEEVFRASGFNNNVASISNSMSVDLGHSLPVIPSAALYAGRELTAEAKAAAKDGRLFISGNSDWALSHARQITIEPNLVSMRSPRLPQVSPHYLVSVTNDAVTIDDECDELLADLGLLRM